MNSKLLKASLAGVAAIGLAAGGSTLAAYSDFNLSGTNNVGAGILKLSVEGNTSGDVPFNQVHMAPGGINQVRNVYVATNDGASTPSARLYVSLVDLHGHEDGCDGGEASTPDDCTDTAGPGDFIDDATMQFTSYAVNSPGDCNESYAPSGKVVTGQHGGSLATVASQPKWEVTGNGTTAYGANGINRSYLAPGQGLCVSLDIGLAYGVDNASQGDSADFVVRFDLEQAPYGTPTTPLP